MADDRLSDAQIAAQLGIGRRTLATWKAHPAFQARVAELVDRYRRAVQVIAISEHRNRMGALDRRWRAMLRVIAERAADLAMAGVPGASTGLLVRTVKTAGAGGDARLVGEFRIDVKLLRELREHERQAAREMGRWEAPDQQSDAAMPLIVIVSSV